MVFPSTRAPSRAGELFFALSPEDYRRHCFTATSFADAHRFIPRSVRSGAPSRRSRARRASRATKSFAPFVIACCSSKMCIDALQSVARGTIEAWGRPVVAVTGSAGKTTTKDLTAHVLGSTGRRVLRSRKNYNNELGVALSVLQMESDGARPEEFDVAVLEMGMSMPGEIARHCRGRAARRRGACRWSRPCTLSSWARSRPSPRARRSSSKA